MVEVNLIGRDGPVPADRRICFRAAPAASVINVASVYGIVASRGPMAAYNATKAALIDLTRHLAAVWGHAGAGQRPRTRLLPHRVDRVPGRPRVRAVHPRPHAAWPHPGHRRTRWPAAVPRHCRLQLHDWASPGHRRRMDRSMNRHSRRHCQAAPLSADTLALPGSHTAEWLRGLFHPDPAEQVLPADRIQQGRMVGGHVPAGSSLPPGHRYLLGPRTRTRIESAWPSRLPPSFYAQPMARMLA